MSLAVSWSEFISRWATQLRNYCSVKVVVQIKIDVALICQIIMDLIPFLFLNLFRYSILGPAIFVSIFKSYSFPVVFLTFNVGEGLGQDWTFCCRVMWLCYFFWFISMVFLAMPVSCCSKPLMLFAVWSVLYFSSTFIDTSMLIPCFIYFRDWNGVLFCW